ncbi:hypothetical protein Dimus_028742 [Dionaea muscipula]
MEDGDNENGEVLRLNHITQESMKLALFAAPRKDMYLAYMENLQLLTNKLQSMTLNAGADVIEDVGTTVTNNANDPVEVFDPEAYTYDDEVIKKAEEMGKPGLVEIYAKEDSFTFTVETTGAIKASQLVFNAIEILKQKLDAVRLFKDTVEIDNFGELGAHMRGG